MRLLVTGAGRSGTWWLTHALRACGVPADHETAYTIDRHGEGDWDCEVSWLAAPYTPVADTHVVHMVRDPLATIASRVAWGSFEDNDPAGRYDPRIKGRWAIEHCPQITTGTSPVERAAIHWVEWNRMVRGADELLRLEDCTADEVWRLASIVDPSAHRPELPAPTNQSKAPARLTWTDVAHIDGLVELAATYGYHP